VPHDPPKPRKRWSLLVLLAVAACVVGLAIALFRPLEHASAALAPSADETSAAKPRSTSALEGEPSAASEGRQSAPSSAEEPGPPMQPGLAKLRLRAVDAQSGALLDSVRVRAASSTRFADREAPGSGQIELTLTPGSYTLCVFSRGYEPVELAAVELSAGARVTLDPVRMSAGSARIDGFARGDPAGLRVELLGEGRRPCPQCLDAPGVSNAAERDGAWRRETPCAACGYSARVSLLALAPDGRFHFEGLLAGRYSLRLVDVELHTVGLPQSFELHPGEVLALECEAGQQTIELELVDVDGTSLARVWGRRMNAAALPEGEALPEFESIDSGASAREFACSFHAGEIGIARSSLVPPTPPGVASGSGGTSIGVGFHGRKQGGGRANGSDDRPREKSDALRPEALAPTVPVPTISCAVGGDGLARFDPVPAIALSLELSCGPYHATLELPAAKGRQRVRARLACDTLPPDVAHTFLEYEAGLRR